MGEMGRNWLKGRVSSGHWLDLSFLIFYSMGSWTTRCSKSFLSITHSKENPKLSFKLHFASYPDTGDEKSVLALQTWNIDVMLMCLWKLSKFRKTKHCFSASLETSRSISIIKNLILLLLYSRNLKNEV